MRRLADWKSRLRRAWQHRDPHRDLHRDPHRDPTRAV